MYGIRDWIDVLIGVLILGVVVCLLVVAIPTPPPAVTLDTPAVELYIKSK